MVNLGGGGFNMSLSYMVRRTGAQNFDFDEERLSVKSVRRCVYALLIFDSFMLNLTYFEIFSLHFDMILMNFNMIRRLLIRYSFLRIDLDHY